MLFIGLNGCIGSGKDTVAKMLKVILNREWVDKEACRAYYKKYFESHRYATTDAECADDDRCTCIAFADQLKRLCSVMFGVPLDRFWWNKENSWVCINRGFEYTEQEPYAEHIITAEDYASGTDRYLHSQEKWWMSLRELLVYVGTYVCQKDINPMTFVNNVNTEVRARASRLKDRLKYVICTDVRFMHEYDYVMRKNGIMINITRDGVTAPDNVAEHDLDMFGPENFNYTIYNEGVSYDDLFDSVWNLVHENPEFEDFRKEMTVREEGADSYLRLVGERKWRICDSGKTVGLKHSTDCSTELDYIDLCGGPLIERGKPIPGTAVIPEKILYDEFVCCYFIVEKQSNFNISEQ